MDDFDDEDKKERPNRKKKRELSAEEIEKGRKEILESVANKTHKTLRDKVAWILNHWPPARNSDVELSLRYWEQFQGDLIQNGVIKKENLFKLTRIVSLTRERARIQNDFKLFLAKEEVRRRRGKLEEEQFATAITTNPGHPLTIVYADESGKNEEFLLVGS